MDDKSIICDFKNLYVAYRKAKSCKKYNGSSARFQSMALEGVHELKKQLEDQAYCMSSYNEFTIHEPKERIIKSCAFKDKVVQHCLCDNIILPRLKNEFIRCNYAGQIGKGTLYGMDKLKEQMLSYYLEHGCTGWILKCDIAKFFYRIDHTIVKDIMDYYFPDTYTVWLNHLFIDSTDGLGLPLGNQVAQVYALMMLNGVDHMITGDLGIQYYGRYMDDFYLIHQNKEYLKDCLVAIKEMAESLHLELNGKTQIVPFKNGISFTGFHHYVTDDGKYIRKLKGENKRKQRKKVKNMVNAIKSGKMSQQKMQERYCAWKNHVSHGNCIKLTHTMDLYVEKLLKKQNRR